MPSYVGRYYYTLFSLIPPHTLFFYSPPHVHFNIVVPQFPSFFALSASFVRSNKGLKGAGTRTCVEVSSAKTTRRSSLLPSAAFSSAAARHSSRRRSRCQWRRRWLSLRPIASCERGTQRVPSSSRAGKPHTPSSPCVTPHFPQRSPHVSPQFHEQPRQ